jgi:hypothetical protein
MKQGNIVVWRKRSRGCTAYFLGSAIKVAIIKKRKGKWKWFLSYADYMFVLNGENQLPDWFATTGTCRTLKQAKAEGLASTTIMLRMLAETAMGLSTQLFNHNKNELVQENLIPGRHVILRRAIDPDQSIREILHIGCYGPAIGSCQVSTFLPWVSIEDVEKFVASEDER